VPDDDWPPATVLVDTDVTCAEVVRSDERLLRSGAPAIHVAVVSDLTVSYGVGVRESAPFLERARAAGIALVRRTSGGTGVLHAPGDLVWSLVLPRSDPRVGSGFVGAYGRLGAGVVRFLRRRGVASEWTAPPHLVPDLCVLSGRGQVLAVDDRVLGGAAQHVSRSALLHQGMIPLDVDRERIARLFDIPGPEPMARLAGLRDLDVEGGAADLAHGLASALADEQGGPEV
jgi:lipoate-protein ligase A